MSHDTKEDKNVLYTLSICRMSTRRTKTYCVEYVFVLLVDMTYAECVEYVVVLLLDM
jgi:hypothetical protein